MEVIVLESEAFEKLQHNVLRNVNRAIQNAMEEASAKLDPALDWLDDREAKKLLGIKSKTKLQELRDHGAIKFSKAGKTIRYSKTSILEYLERHVPRM